MMSMWCCIVKFRCCEKVTKFNTIFYLFMKLFTNYLVMSRYNGRFFLNFLRPSQNIRTLVKRSFMSVPLLKTIICSYNAPFGKSTSSKQEDLISRSEWVLEAQPRITEMTLEVAPSWQSLLLLDCFPWLPLLKLFSWKSALTAADICCKKTEKRRWDGKLESAKSRELWGNVLKRFCRILFVCYWTVSLGFHCLNYFRESQLLLLQTFTAKKRKKRRWDEKSTSNNNVEWWGNVPQSLKKHFWYFCNPFTK